MTHMTKLLLRRAIFAVAFVIVFLGVSSFNYQLALPGRQISLPADHVSHPDFKTEWWYYTGHLETEAGRRYGYQVTFFRFGLRDRQRPKEEIPPLFTDLYMAHFALSDIEDKKFLFRERLNRGYAGKAGASTERYLVWNEDWRVEEKGGDQVIHVKDRGAALRLNLTSLKAPVLHGQRGLSQKGEGDGRASYYYSLTRLKTEGDLEVAGKKEKVRGLSWMDHEFGSNQLREDQIGWDWFSIQLENNIELMLYLIRRKDGTPDPYSSGTLVYADGRTRHLKLRDFQIEVLKRWKSSKSGGDYPMGWKIKVPSEELELNIEPFFAEQELNTEKSTRVTYWEGAVRVDGIHNGRPVRGSGYTELTGYAGKLRV